MRPENINDNPLKSSISVSKPKRHHQPLKKPKLGLKAVFQVS